MRLVSAIIFVNDLPRMAAFYSEKLGLKRIEATRLENYVELDAGGAVSALHAIPADLRCEAPSSPRETNPIKLSFQVADADAEGHRLESLGVPVLRRPWGACDAVDPEGNVFGLYCA